MYLHLIFLASARTLRGGRSLTSGRQAPHPARCISYLECASACMCWEKELVESLPSECSLAFSARCSLFLPARRSLDHAQVQTSLSLESQPQSSISTFEALLSSMPTSPIRLLIPLVQRLTTSGLSLKALPELSLRFLQAKTVWCMSDH